MDFARRPWLLPLGLAVVAQPLFLFRLGTPHTFVFDEVHYVPAARALLALDGPINLEHPLFAKALIALGMMLFGDDSFGWRFVATLAGTGTVVAIYAIATLLTGQRRAGAVAGALALFGNTLFVQARIAMLDTFMAALLAGGLALLLWALRSERRQWPKWLSGALLLGLAIGCKWTALPYVGMAGAGLIALRWRTGRMLALPVVPALVTLGAVAGAVYLATFLPAFFYARNPLTLATVLPFQARMYALQTQVLPSHVYQSNWWTWPLTLRPIWYFYEVADGAQRGILLVANPLLAWGGLVAVAACLWIGARRRSLSVLAAAALWTGSVAMWAAIPKSLGFYYYYYPSTLWLAVALGVAFARIDPGGRRRWDEWYVTATIAVFAYFWPILSAAPLGGPEAFHRWTWFAGWV